MLSRGKEVSRLIAQLHDGLVSLTTRNALCLFSIGVDLLKKEARLTRFSRNKGTEAKWMRVCICQRNKQRESDG